MTKEAATAPSAEAPTTYVLQKACRLSRASRQRGCRGWLCLVPCRRARGASGFPDWPGEHLSPSTFLYRTPSSSPLSRVVFCTWCVKVLRLINLQGGAGLTGEGARWGGIATGWASFQFGDMARRPDDDDQQASTRFRSSLSERTTLEGKEEPRFAAGRGGSHMPQVPSRSRHK